MSRPTARVSEEAWQAQVVQLAGVYGWQTMHVRRSKGRRDQWVTTTSVTGWPDLFCWHPQRGCMVLELKSDTGRPTAEQLTVLRSLACAGVPAFIARPRDVFLVVDLFRHGPQRAHAAELAVLPVEIVGRAPDGERPDPHPPAA